MILQPFTDLSDEAAKENGDEDEASYGRREDESEDESSPPPAGNTEGEGLKLNKTQMKEARGTASPEQINVKVCTSFGVLRAGRARRKLEELEVQLEIAKKNFTQLGGKVAEDRRLLKQERDLHR